MSPSHRCLPGDLRAGGRLDKDTGADRLGKNQSIKGTDVPWRGVRQLCKLKRRWRCHGWLSQAFIKRWRGPRSTCMKELGASGSFASACHGQR